MIHPAYATAGSDGASLSTRRGKAKVLAWRRFILEAGGRIIELDVWVSTPHRWETKPDKEGWTSTRVGPLVLAFKVTL